MGELRAYALPIAELLAVAGASGDARDRYAGLAQRAFSRRAPSLAERLGPIYRQVPGLRPISEDEPTPSDLETFLDGRPLPPARALAGWRLVEAFAAGLARATTTVDAADLPADLLRPIELLVPRRADLVAAWCRLDAARSVPSLRGWAAGLDPTLPGPDVVVLGQA